MDVLECIRTRCSVRKYKNMPVEWEKVGIILNAALGAPSSGNVQNWKFIVVLDAEKRKKIAEACLEQYWMETAPVHVIVCSEPEKAKRFYGVRGERLYSVQNCAAASQNIILAAHSLGIGSCWVGAFDEDALKKILGIPDYIRPQNIITLGYAEQREPKAGRYRIYDMVFLESWENRIKDLNWVIKDYSVTINKKAAEKAKKAARKGKEIIEKGKNIVGKIAWAVFISAIFQHPVKP